MQFIILTKEPCNCFNVEEFLNLNESDYSKVSINKEDTNVIDLMEKNRIGDTTIITVANYGHKLLLMNWIHNLERNNYTKFVILAYDNLVFDYLVSKGYRDHVAIVPKSWYQNYNVSSDPHDFRKNGYDALVMSKTCIFFNLLTLDQKFVFSDDDIVWMNPRVIDYLNMKMSNSHAQLLFSEDFYSGMEHFNVGFFYVKPTVFTKRIFDKLIQNQIENPKLLDQWNLNALLSKIKHNDNRIQGLDKVLFANGHYYFNSNLHLMYNVTPFVVHANYFGTIELKINQFKKKNLWFVADGEN